MDAYKTIVDYINGVHLQIYNQGGKYLTRTDLWRYGKYQQLKEQIERQITELGQQQIKILDELTQKVFEKTLETTLSDLMPKDVNYNLLTKTLEKQNLDIAWSGKNYSQRVWENTNNLASNLHKQISDLIVLGKSPETIKDEVMDTFNVGYDVADRLIRTEASYAYNTASITAYRTAGIRKVEYIADSDDKRCSKCGGYSAVGIYDIGTEPTLPAHPRCRCCYAPVVELTPKKA